MLVFFFNDTATTEISTLSLPDALPICPGLGPAAALAPLRRAPGRRPPGDHDPPARHARRPGRDAVRAAPGRGRRRAARDRKSTRLNSSHANISYAVFCLKKKKKLLLSTSTQTSFHNKCNITRRLEIPPISKTQSHTIMILVIIVLCYHSTSHITSVFNIY